jgi:hypothetical protein
LFVVTKYNTLTGYSLGGLQGIDGSFFEDGVFNVSENNLFLLTKGFKKIFFPSGLKLYL